MAIALSGQIAEAEASLARLIDSVVEEDLMKPQDHKCAEIEPPDVRRPLPSQDEGVNPTCSGS
jgi:hypothetical protein